ncbi:MAG: hypothetical protein AAF600_02830 [Bacteroidota bacterium]
MKQKFFSFGTKWFITLMALLLINACSQEEDVSQSSSGIVDEASNLFSKGEPVFIFNSHATLRFYRTPSGTLCSTLKPRNYVICYELISPGGGGDKVGFIPIPGLTLKPEIICECPPCFICPPFSDGPEAVIDELRNGTISFKNIAEFLEIEISPSEGILYSINENLALMQIKNMPIGGNDDATFITTTEDIITDYGKILAGDHPGFIDEERGIVNVVCAVEQLP